MFRKTFRIAVRQILRNRVRSFLTMLGVVIVVVGLFMPGGLVRLRPVQRVLAWLGLPTEEP